VTSPALFHAYATYNTWMNAKVYDVCAGIPDAERKADRGAFFKSVHGTLNHLMFGDFAWLNRLAGTSFDVSHTDEILYEAFDDMRAAREVLDAQIEEWAGGLSPEWLDAEMVWTSMADNVERRQPRWLLTLHMFNHQTHHRGQLTTLLTQMGRDVGVTDLPRMDL